jgi:multiple sugar transport system permease protein
VQKGARLALSSASLGRLVRSSRPRRHIRTLNALLWLVPALALVSFSVLYPLLRSVYISFFNYQIFDFQGGTFAGFKNFAAIPRDHNFTGAIGNTLAFALTSVFIAFTLGLLLALVIASLPKRMEFLRVIFLIPWVLPGAVVGLFAVFFFDQEVGLLNLTLNHLHIGPQHFAWLSNATTAMPSVISVNVWAQIPFFLLVFTAALTAIPHELREAMRIDGATPWQELRYLTLPYLRNVMVIISLVAFIGNINNFGLIWTMTQGGPANATQTIALYIYQLAFQIFNFGYSSAIGVVWLAAVMVVAAIYIRILRREALN